MIGTILSFGFLKTWLTLCQDPGLAPASKLTLFTMWGLHRSYQIIAGTPEAGGWTTRELKRIIRGLAGLNFVYVLPSLPFP